MTFTADNLPEAARALLMYPTARFDNGMPLNLNSYTASVLNRLDAAHGDRLSKLLNGAAAVETASPSKLPEWAKATADDLLLMSGKTFSNEADPLNYHAARVLARMPVQTLSDNAVERAAKIIYERAMSFDRGGVPAWQERGNSDAQERARDVARDILARESHCQKPADPVRFALEKVAEEQWRKFFASVNDKRYADGHGGFRWPSSEVEALISELARILSVAEPVKPWADLTDGQFGDILAKANDAFHRSVQGGAVYADAKASCGAFLRASLSAYAPPPRKVEVTPEVVNVYLTARGLDKSAYDSMELAIAQANSQAEARESEETARLKGEVERLQTESRDADVVFKKMNGQIERLTKERDLAVLECQQTGEQLRQERSLHAGTKSRAEHAERERDEAMHSANARHEAFAEAVSDLDDLRAHADKLEAWLTVDGVDGQVKLWEGFDVQLEVDLTQWVRGEFVPSVTWGSRAAAWTFANFYGSHSLPARRIRQSPAPEAELKRWRVKSIWDDVEEHVTKPMTRTDAEAIGEVIGEAGE